MKKVLLGAACFFLVYVGIHLKNYFQVGEFFLVIKDDVFDKAFGYINFPGQIPTLFLIVMIFWNIHNYPFWFSETISLIFNCMFYGFTLGKLLPNLCSRLKRMTQLHKGG